MIEQIENTDLFFFKGAVVKKDDIIAHIDRLYSIIQGNEAYISQQNLIDCSNLQGDILEAATMFNEAKQTEINKLQGEIDHFTAEITNIEKWL